MRQSPWGGPPDQARAMRSLFATELNVPLPEGDWILRLELESEEVATLLSPMLDEFRNLGWCFIDECGNPINHLFQH